MVLLELGGWLLGGEAIGSLCGKSRQTAASAVHRNTVGWASDELSGKGRQGATGMASLLWWRL